MRSWLAKLKKLDSAINVAKTRRERRKLYGRFLKTASKAAWHLGDEVIRPHSAAADADLPPPPHQTALGPSAGSDAGKSPGCLRDLPAV